MSFGPLCFDAQLIDQSIALVKNEIRVVQASLAGSILANLLLILGMAFFVGGLEYREQFYDSTATQMSACLLALSVLSLLIPVRAVSMPKSVLDADSRSRLPFMPPLMTTSSPIQQY